MTGCLHPVTIFIGIMPPVRKITEGTYDPALRWFEIVRTALRRRLRDDFRNDDRGQGSVRRETVEKTNGRDMSKISGCVLSTGHMVALLLLQVKIATGD